jgi:DNA-binding LytR/AlgR family response regulator
MNHSIKITVVEDDFLISDFIENALNSMGYHLLEICRSYDECINSINRETPDLLLIDIRIEGDKNGIEIGRYLRAHSDIPFIFISSLSDKKTIDQAKRTLPAAYLIKPFEESDLYAAIEIAFLNHVKRRGFHVNTFDEGLNLNDTILIKQNQVIVKVRTIDILYVEAKDNYVKICTYNDFYMIRKTIQDFMKTLPVFFFKVHRSYIVNLNFITELRSEEIILSNQISLPVSRATQSEFLQYWNSHRSKPFN